MKISAIFRDYKFSFFSLSFCMFSKLLAACWSWGEILPESEINFTIYQHIRVVAACCGASWATNNFRNLKYAWQRYQDLQRNCKMGNCQHISRCRPSKIKMKQWNLKYRFYYSKLSSEDSENFQYQWKICSASRRERRWKTEKTSTEKRRK